MTKIAVIAGHGSNTAGKRTPNIPGHGVEKEHSINCRTAHFVSEALKRCGFEVVKIGWVDKYGKNDRDIPICERQNMVRAAKVDASIDCHANASNSKDLFDSASGASTYVSDTLSKRQDSKRLATLIQKNLCQGTVQKDRGVNSGNLGMCNATYMRTKASVLIEIGFMTNLEEAKLMLTEKFCKEQAEDAVKGFCEFFGKAYKAETPVPTTAPTTTQVSEVPAYTVGKVYKLKYGMKVRKTPAIADNVLKYSELSANAKENAEKNGVLKTGTAVTCKEVRKADGYIWIRTPSGWIAAYNITQKKEYIQLRN